MLTKQLEIKKNRVNLIDRINNTKKYSYEWFKAYLELLTTYVEKQSTTTQKSISFQEIKPYKADNKYFLLCGASNYISPEIESAEDFKISLIFKHEKKENIVVEGVSKKGQDLLIYCRESLPNDILSRLSNVFKVEINFTPIIDLLERLSKAFANSEYINEWDDIQEAMPSLNYIYGPPGTGKTTTLCNEISTLLEENPTAKFLVLTPTNKAADVVCKKLCTNNRDLAISIVRLSRPTDPELEEYGIYRDTLEAETMQSINVVASTIHRLPYFVIQNESLLFEYPWDYVIFDESSMTGLHYITFAIMALFKTNENTKFIIAGDPKQIPPVVEINDTELENFDFQDENIYRMMGLESFKSDEQIIRDIDTIQNLGTQYRSIPQIGQLFSDLSYSSLLKHDRATNRKDCKPLPKKISNLITSNVTFIDIPLDKDNSIYKINKLVYSSYQTYCAILVAEIIKYFDNAVDNKSWAAGLSKYFDNAIDNKNWTIGLIAPYKAQAILLNKLVTSYGISENVKVYSDTVHGFQGDECDIVFFVCNPNNYYYTGHEKSLLSKEYIYNVAISRAKDYLVVLYPYSKIIDNGFIKAIRSSSDKHFRNAKIVNSKEIEKVLFNEENYIENNSYVSGHDNVNVFGISEMKYFIKSNDTAIDIQLGNLQKKK
jgi:superfamily I DNA and/or RNA helicase